MATKKKQTTDDRSENWTFIVFTSSLDQDWLLRLRSTFVPTLISPEHDADISENGEKKLPHYHIQFIYESKKSADQVWQDALYIGRNAIGGSSFKEFFEDYEVDQIKKFKTRGEGKELYNAYDKDGKSFGQIQKVKSRCGMAQYLCHMNNPEKAQYDTTEIQRYCIDEEKLVQYLGGSYNKHQVIREMKQYCRENEIIYFSDLCDYAEEYHPETWEKALNDCAAYIMDKYIKGLSYKYRSSAQDKANEAYRKYCEEYQKLEQTRAELLEKYGVIEE